MELVCITIGQYPLSNSHLFQWDQTAEENLVFRSLLSLSLCFSHWKGSSQKLYISISPQLVGNTRGIFTCPAGHNQGLQPDRRQEGRVQALQMKMQQTLDTALCCTDSPKAGGALAQHAVACSSSVYLLTPPLQQPGQVLVVEVKVTVDIPGRVGALRHHGRQQGQAAPAHPETQSRAEPAATPGRCQTATPRDYTERKQKGS